MIDTNSLSEYESRIVGFISNLEEMTNMLNDTHAEIQENMEDNDDGVSDMIMRHFIEEIDMLTRAINILHIIIFYIIQ